jgi:hypothetical protein
MSDTAIVDARGARQLAPLQMKCDNQEIPEALDGAKPSGWWLVGVCSFSGPAAKGGETGTLGETADTQAEGTAALAVGGGRVFGIVSPNTDVAAAIWWSWPLSEVRVEAVGSQGFLKKRPTQLTLKTSDAQLTLAFVSRLYRNSGSRQSGQEASLLKALGS